MQLFLFMKRVKENSHWTLFCPNEAPGLSDCFGEEFENLYLKYEEIEAKSGIFITFSTPQTSSSELKQYF